MIRLSVGSGIMSLIPPKKSTWIIFVAFFNASSYCESQKLFIFTLGNRSIDCVFVWLKIISQGEFKINLFALFLGNYSVSIW